MTDEKRHNVRSENTTEPLSSCAAGAAPPRPSGVSLIIYHRGGVDAKQLIFGKKLVVGRSESVKGHIPDGSLSRRHAQFTLLEDGVLVEDLGSTNGTWIAEKRITGSVKLELSGEAKLGGVLVQVTDLGMHIDPAAANKAEKLMDPTRGGANCATPEQLVVVSSMAESKKGVEGEQMIVGKAQQKLRLDAELVSSGRDPVILHGETGTGKEVWATFIHKKGSRRDKRFICVNCGAIHESLIESILFGHEKGAFTGALQQRRGVFEDAHQGTLFLDEIGELSPAAQAALLRVLDSGIFLRVGSTNEVAVDVRIIAATHRDLEQMVRDGGFREDLFYRLNTVVLKIPPLRERRDEIEELAKRFLRKANQENGRSVQGFSEEAMALLRAHSWPGNVRALRSGVTRAVLMGRDTLIQPSDLLLSSTSFELSGDVKESAVTTRARAKEIGQQVEARTITRALEENNWSRAAAAKQLGTPLRTLARRIKNLGIRELRKR